MSTTVARVIRNTGYLYVRMGITMFISLYTTRIILQALGASDFGVFNIVGGINCHLIGRIGIVRISKIRGCLIVRIHGKCHTTLYVLHRRFRKL